jgi:hypothetical protein
LAGEEQMALPVILSVIQQIFCTFFICASNPMVKGYKKINLVHTLFDFGFGHLILLHCCIPLFTMIVEYFEHFNAILLFFLGPIKETAHCLCLHSDFLVIDLAKLGTKHGTFQLKFYGHPSPPS